MEQEVEARERSLDEHGDIPYFEKRFQQGDRSISLLGMRHSSELVDTERDVAAYKKIDPEILIHEGNDIREVFRDIFPGMTDDQIRELDPAAVAENQEQIFLAWQAWKDGKVVQSWDLPFEDQLKIIGERHSPHAIAGFMVSIVLGKLYEQGVSPTYEAMEGMLSRVLSAEAKDALAQHGINGTVLPSIDATIQRYLKTTLEVLKTRFGDEAFKKQDIGFFHSYFDPAYPGETNAVLRDMNVIRDQHAIDVIEEAKTKYKNVLVVAGGSHVRTWGPAVAELYK